MLGHSERRRVLCNVLFADVQAESRVAKKLAHAIDLIQREHMIVADG